MDLKSSVKFIYIILTCCMVTAKSSIACQSALQVHRAPPSAAAVVQATLHSAFRAFARGVHLPKPEGGKQLRA